MTRSASTALPVGIALFPGFQILDVAGPLAVFEVASHFVRAAGTGAGYRVRLLSPAGGTVVSSCGAAMVSKPLTLRRIDTLLVPGGDGTRGADPHPTLLDFVRQRATTCRRVASVCTGAFLLARTGLLDGRRVTTHWRHAEALARRYPALQVLADRIWVNDGPIWSSAGVSAGIDLALALVGEDFGREVARRTAREVVVYYQRPGGQSQFSTLEELSDDRGRFAPLLGWIRANLQQSLKVEDLAARMAMSPRNFARRFRAEVGCTPAQAVARLRLEVARTQVETTRRPIAEVARVCGYGDPETMRRAFVAALGQPPRALRTASRGQRPATELTQGNAPRTT